jgi:hypothetical protein
MNDKPPKLRRIHSDETLEQGIARFSLKFWRAKSNREIIKSLQIGEVESLKAKSDGRILNGNIRCKVLEERGFDVNILEHEIV